MNEEGKEEEEDQARRSFVFLWAVVGGWVCFDFGGVGGLRVNWDEFKWEWVGEEEKKEEQGEM